MASRSKPSTAEGGAPVVIYIHGIGRHAPREALRTQWDLALFGRELGERSRMAYWSDLLHPPAAPAPGTQRRRRSAAEPTLEAWLARAPSVEAHDFALRLLGQLDPAGPPATGPGKKVLPLPAWARKPISRAFLQAFVADTAAYFFTPGLRARIGQRLLDEIAAARGRAVTLVAHSQGTVIAHEVLAALAPGRIDLRALLTLGSPLGIQEVQDFIEPQPLAVPDAVARWSNFADPLDPVALDKGLRNDFGPSAGGTRIDDDVIVNDRTRRLWGFNPHSAVGYLAHARVRRVVHDAMRMDSMARFVLARDVAERLGAEAQARHPVLIEVLEPGYGALGEDREHTALVEALECAARGGAPLRLEDRIRRAAEQLATLVADAEAARIDPLRRFVAAHLTAAELQQVGARHRELRVYAVWQSARKAKLTDRRSLSALKADAALASFAADGRGITWAVLDTGVQADHPHLKDVIAAVYDCTRPGPPRRLENAVDREGHGSHVAGIIAGRSAPGRAVGPDGETDLRGLAPGARLVVYKVLDDAGQGEDAWIIKALDHIARQNENTASGLAIHGVNLSLGGPFDDSVYGCGFSPLCAELRRLWRDGVLVVAACGNEGQLNVQTPDGEVEINTPMSVGDPANLEECIAVGSVHADRPYLYGISPFSSRGPTADGRAKPDVVAPGERILSCNAQWSRAKGSQYRYDSGTSMAAPHVSGLLAAFLAVRREFRGRPDEVKRILLQCCSDLGRDRYHQGHGLPNLMQMLLTV